MVERVLQVQAGPHARLNCPVSADCADVQGAGPFEVVDAAGRALPAQVLCDTGTAQVHWIVPFLAAHEQRAYRLRPAAHQDAPAVALARADDRVSVSILGQPFTSYWFGAGGDKPYLHPLMGPSGSVTRQWPMAQVAGETTDHPHHKGCFVSWGNVNGWDLWHEGKALSGRQALRQVVAADDGVVFGRLALQNEWVGRNGTPLLEERREYRFYATPASARIVDLRLELRALAEPVRLGDTKEGGWCTVRVATTMDVPRGGQITNAWGGINEPETWGQRSPWCDYSGPVGGAWAGVAILDHPDNPHYPTYWHVRNYGLMAANPHGLSFYHARRQPRPDGSLTLPPGSALAMRFRVVVHAGTAAEADVAGHFLAWAHPPRVVVS